MKCFIHVFLRILISVICSVAGSVFVFSQPQKIDEKLLISAIGSGDIKTVQHLINASSVNYITEQKLTPLVLAIKANQPDIVKLLLMLKSDPNLSCQGLTPLMYACQEASGKQIRLLLSKGAKINETDSAGNTALMYAAVSQKIKTVNLLVRQGALLNVRNHDDLRAYDIAIHSNNQPVAHYLRSVFENHLPDYFDGPYAQYQGKHKIQLSYFKHDSHNGHTDKFTQHYILKKDIPIYGFAGDTASYRIKTKYKPEKSFISGVNKMFVIGDVHGQYDTLCKFLINNQIIDKSLRWKFGQGHIVFLGDIFDRGEKVTETLWLIYRLEHEATLTGGGVHLILGNHEIMVLTDDKRSQLNISDKYYFIFRDLKLDYNKFYNNKTVLGRWLRSKNAMLKINDILFVHGGIDPGLLKYKVSIDSVNITIYRYLTDNQKHKEDSEFLSYLLSANGPFWYRGLIPHQTYKDLPEEDINRMLTSFNATAIMVGHTTLKHVTSYYSGKIFGLDVPFYLLPGKPMQAVYIDFSGYYKVYSNGEKDKIK